MRKKKKEKRKEKLVWEHNFYDLKHMCDDILVHGTQSVETSCVINNFQLLFSDSKKKGGTRNETRDGRMPRRKIKKKKRKKVKKLKGIKKMTFVFSN